MRIGIKMTENMIPCVICKKPLRDHDKVYRILKGLIYDTPYSTSLDVNNEFWAHLKCFDNKFEIKLSEEISLFKEDRETEDSRTKGD